MFRYSGSFSLAARFFLPGLLLEHLLADLVGILALSHLLRRLGATKEPERSPSQRLCWFADVVVVMVDAAV